MMQSYSPTLYLVGAYFIVVMIGPRIMVNRKPLNVQLPMLTYNFALVLLSLYMFYEVGVMYVQCVCIMSGVHKPLKVVHFGSS